MDKKRVIIALDFTDGDSATSFLHLWKDREKPFIKIGYALFFTVGPRWVYERKQEGYAVFLDLKLHDIPQTVHKAILSLLKLEVDFLTLHASGGCEMIKAAKEAVDKQNSTMKLLAVTQLTSTSQEMLQDEIGIPGSIEECVFRYTKQALCAGVDGVVCSGHEVKKLKKDISTPFISVTPGIRLNINECQDQKRVVTPKYAMEQGADYLVVGRPITKAISPVDTYLEIEQQIEGSRVMIHE